MKLKVVDIALWLLVVLAVSLALYQQYFVEASAYRLSFWAAAFVSAMLAGAFTARGREAQVFVKEARGEMAKVVWPKKQDVTTTTLAVGAAVAVFSLLIAFLDSLLVKLLAYITG